MLTKTNSVNKNVKYNIVPRRICRIMFACDIKITDLESCKELSDTSDDDISRDRFDTFDDFLVILHQKMMYI